MRNALALLVAVLLVAGCVSAPKKDTPYTPPPKPDAMAKAYDKIRASLNGTQCSATGVTNSATSANLKLLGSFKPLGNTAVGELAVRGNRTAQAYQTTRGYVLLNITDPANPRLQTSGGIGTSQQLLAPTNQNPPTYDVKFSSDGTILLVALNDRIVGFDLTRSTPFFTPATLMNPSDYRGDNHMLAVKRMGNFDYIFSVPGRTGAGMLVARLAGSGSAARLELVKTYPAPTPTPQNPQPFAAADAYITNDSIDGVPHTLLYLANGLGGIAIWNVDDPANAQPVIYVPPEASAPPSYTSNIQMQWLDGKRIVVTSAEAGYSVIKVWDFTVLKAPKFLGQWSLDSNAPAHPSHDLQIVNGTLLVAHYADGLFGFDLRSFAKDPKAGLKPVLHFQQAAGGAVWDVGVQDGLLYVSDLSQGLTVLAYGCYTPGDKSLTSTG